MVTSLAAGPAVVVFCVCTCAKEDTAKAMQVIPTASTSPIFIQLFRDFIDDPPN
jgi:hypothetical protein